MELEGRLKELWSTIKDLRDLEHCSLSIKLQLRTVSSDLLNIFSVDSSVQSFVRRFRETILIAEALLVLADEKLLCYPYDKVPVIWRQLYTDSTLIKVSAIFAGQFKFKKELDAVDWLAFVRLLDMVLIVSGAPGCGRKEAIFCLIQSVQAQYIKDIPTETQSLARPCKRARIPNNILGISRPSLSPAPLQLKSLPILDVAPSIEDFCRNRHSSPFVIKAYCHDWPSISKTPWKDINYLKDVAGPGRVVPVEIGRSYTEEDWSQKIINWNDFLDGLEECNSDGKLMYLAQYDLFKQLPSLREGIILPDYVYCELPPKCRPTPSGDEDVIFNTWMGPAGTVSPAHTDPYYNCYVQVVGKKHVWVAPPHLKSEMYPFGSSSIGEETLQSTFMTNTSQVDVLNHDVRQLREQFPEFVSQVMPQAMQVVLEEGDLLFMPPGWWHSMRSLQTSINVSMWF